MLKKIPKIYKKYIYSKNITYDPGKLSFMHNVHYIKMLTSRNFTKTFKLPKSWGHVLCLNVKNSAKSFHNISRAFFSI